MRVRHSLLVLLTLKASLGLTAFAGEAAPDATPLPFGAIAKFKASENKGETRGQFSNSGELLAVGGAGHTTLWNLQTGATTLDLPGETMLGASGRLRWFYLNNGTGKTGYRVMNVAVTPIVQVPATVEAGYIAFSPNTHFLAFADRNQDLTLYRSPPVEAVGKYIFAGDGTVPCALCFSPNSRELAAAIGSMFKLIETSSGKILHEDRNFPGGGSSAFSPDGKTLAVSTSSNEAKDPKISLYDLTAHKVRFSFGADFGSEHLAYLPDGMALVYRGKFNTSHLGELRICDAETGGPFASLAIPESKVSGFSVSPNGKVLAAGDDQGTLYLWDIGQLILKTDPAPVDPKAADLEPLWALLTGKDSSVAYRAMWKLASCGDPGIKFLEGKYKTLPRNQPRIDALIEGLDSEVETTRAAARKELVGMGDPIIEDLRKVAEGPTRPHAKGEANSILSQIDVADAPPPPKTPEELQHVRGILALELSGSTSARAALEKLAGSAAAPAERHYARQASAVASRTVELAQSLRPAAGK